MRDEERLCRQVPDLTSVKEERERIFDAIPENVLVIDGKQHSSVVYNEKLKGNYIVKSSPVRDKDGFHTVETLFCG